MQAPSPELRNPHTLFSRERRRQRMLQFLEAFERRSWRGISEVPFVLSFPSDELREPTNSHIDLPRR